MKNGPEIRKLSKLKEALECAVNDEIILLNPVKNLKYSMVSDSKEFLTVAKLRKLSETPAKDPVVKRMFLFSCLTGLRWSDIVNLKWGNVHAEDGRTYISIRQQKTKGTLTLDLDSQAVALLGTREADSRSIFDFSKRNCNMRYHLLKWVERAGIKKHISFHCARHTFATVMLSRGVDIYTVSKLLGHASVNTTQVYLRLIDDSRQKAMEKIPKIMDLKTDLFP